MAAFTREDIERSIPAAYLDRAEEYLEKGRVSGLRRAAGNHFQASVQGSRSSPYAVDVRLITGRTGKQVYGLCSCPMRVNCKHVAAVLLGVLRNPERVAANAALGVTPPASGDAHHRATAPAAQLPLEIDLWLARTQQTSTPKPAHEDYGPTVLQRLLYVLHLPDAFVGGNARVQLMVARRLKAGGYSAAAPWDHARQAVHNPPAFVLAEDQRILRTLLLDAPHPGADNFVLSGQPGAEILRAMLRTGRCHVREYAQALREGSARRGRLLWRFLEDGTQQIACDSEPSSQRLLPLQPPWYLDLERFECGALETNLEPSLAEALAAAPGVEPQHAARARDAILERLPGVDIPLPQILEPVEVRNTPPTPCLRLITLQAYGRGYRPLSHFFDVAVLTFDYAGARIDRDSPRQVQTFSAGRLLHIHRDARNEKRFHDALKSAGLAQLKDVLSDYPAQHEHDYSLRNSAAWPEFVCERVPELRAAGWRIDFDDHFRFKPVEHIQWFAGVDEASPDWFDLSLGIDLGGERLDMLPVLIAALRARPELLTAKAQRESAKPGSLYLQLDDGRLLPVPLARLQPMLSILHELLDAPPAGSVRLSRLDAVRLADLERDADLHWEGGTALRAFGKRLADFDGIRTVPAPADFAAQLRPYQEQGLAWLQFLREYGLGGILADDMGLGKTVQALAHLLIEKQSGRLDRPALVVAPTSVLPNWKAEAARFAPQLRVHVSHGLKRKTSFAQIAAHDIVLTTYPLLARDQEALMGHEFHLVILDEAQQVKNAQTQAARVVSQLKARNRLCLTGTPLENNLAELWSLFNFLMPGLLGDAATFRRLYRTPIEKHGDEARRNSLARRLRPFLLRRTKEQVAQELPAKTEIVRPIELAGAQRDLYETVRASMHERVRAEIAARGLAQSHIVVLDALLKLRQVCCDPRLVKIDSAKKVKESAKLELLLEMLEELLPEGRRILLFSQFTSMLELIERELAARQTAYVKLTGDTRDRAAPVRKFQDGKVPLFLISLKAGGTGLNLTAADTVIHYDPWWNPAVERQATDRAHRIGQNKPVFVYKLIVSGSVEEKIAALQASKAALAAGILGEGGAASLPLTAEDVKALFEPLG
ncbi:MAG TPA: DEAD/DEAH box helicase [Burkholderiales bacterium]|nr:DEAD/DEAH box helicase [Burkholderiales bacterium]